MLPDKVHCVTPTQSALYSIASERLECTQKHGVHSKAAVCSSATSRWHSLVIESLLPLPDGPSLVMVALDHCLGFVVDFHHAHTVGSQVGHKVLHGEESIM